MKRLYLIRHAQTDWNSENRLQGHSDLPLSLVGQEQARRLGVWLASRHLAGIFTSALRRSQQTAQMIVAGNGHGVHPIIEPDLAEMHLGVWEGLTPEEIESFPSQLWRVDTFATAPEDSLKYPEDASLIYRRMLRVRHASGLTELISKSFKKCSGETLIKSDNGLHYASDIVCGFEGSQIASYPIRAFFKS